MKKKMLFDDKNCKQAGILKTGKPT